jgi:hypothetical protein
MRKGDFTEEDKLKCLLWCDRHCCLCGKPSGSNIEIAHIEPRSSRDRKEVDDIDNAIPLCFECHSEVGKYNREHPRGNKYRNRELKTRRDQIYEKYTRHLVPPIAYQITQEEIRQLPDVGFTLNHLGDSLPIKVLVALEIFLANKSLGLAITENGLYSGKKFLNMNPRSGFQGHFPVPMETVNSRDRLEIRINIKILDQYEREHHLLPVGWVYMRDHNHWFYEPGETLYAGEIKYQFDDWGRFGLV